MQKAERTPDRLTKIDWNKLHSFPLQKLFEAADHYRKVFDLSVLLSKNNERTTAPNVAYELISFSMVAATLPLEAIDISKIPIRRMYRSEETIIQEEFEGEQSPWMMLSYFVRGGISEITVLPDFLDRYFDELSQINSGNHHDRNNLLTVGNFIQAIAHEIGHERQLRQNPQFYLEGKTSSLENNAQGFEWRFLRECIAYCDQNILTAEAGRKTEVLHIMRQACLEALAHKESEFDQIRLNKRTERQMSTRAKETSFLKKLMASLKNMARL